MIAFVASFSNSTNIVFDESHLAVSVTSAAGVLNLIAGSWVSIINTAIDIIVILTVTGFITSLRLRKRIRGKFVRTETRAQRAKARENVPYISHPNYSEKSLSEQYILYQIFKDKFLHVANSALINQLIAADIGHEFIESLHQKYGPDFGEIKNFEVLLEIHNKLRDYVEENRSRLLQ
ncbi:MAG: hypothetical protein IH840_06935 [Candidatus Heimdallarchaeota archaeon]|nr:hypothetical protein [Candidatus Heimdallarchaeota archaeon]